MGAFITQSVFCLQTKRSHSLSGSGKYEHEKADGSRSVARGVDQDLQQRSCGGADDLVDVAGDEEQDDEEDGAGEGADADADDHDLGAFQGGVGDFWLDS